MSIVDILLFHLFILSILGMFYGTYTSKSAKCGENRKIENGLIISSISFVFFLVFLVPICKKISDKIDTDRCSESGERQQ